MPPNYRRLLYAQNGFEAVSMQKPREKHDHDRVLFDGDTKLYGVFDGTAMALASNFVLESISEHLTQLPPENREAATPTELIAYAQTELMHWLKPQVKKILEETEEDWTNLILTTASIVKFRRSSKNLLCLYAGTGDSPIYCFNRDKGLTPLVEDESETTPPLGDEIAHFLGSNLHTLSKYGEVDLKAGDHVVLTSDGVISKRSADGVEPDRVAEILDEQPSLTQAAETILDSSSIKDDKTVIVVKFS